MKRHGDISFFWKDDILTLMVEGALNEETIEYSAPQVQEAVSNHTSKTWQRLEIWDAEVLGSPETIKKCKVVWDWFKLNGCASVAVVVSNNIQREVIEKFLDSKAKTFLDKKSALQWLNCGQQNI